MDERRRLRGAEQGTVDYFRRCAARVGVPPENVHGPIELTAPVRAAGNGDRGGGSGQAPCRDGGPAEHGRGPIGRTALFRAPGDGDFVEALDKALYEEIPTGFVHRDYVVRV